MKVSVACDTRGARDYLKRLEQRDIPRVVGRTLDRTRASVKTFVSREMRQRVNLPKAVVDRAITSRRSGEIQSLRALEQGRAWFEIVVSGKPTALRDFAAKQTTRGVSFKVTRKAARKLYERKGRSSFIIASRGGHVFVRTGPDPKGKLKAPIKKVFGPSLPQFFATKRQRDAAIARAQEVWAAEIIRNARFALQRRGAL